MRGVLGNFTLSPRDIENKGVEFFRRADVRPQRLGILPGTFNPITIAHLALATAALPLMDEVLFVLPKVFPHKEYTGAGFHDRLELVTAAAAGNAAFSVASSDRGLFAEIAGECRQHYGPGVRLTFLCGRDAAERIVSWDYGDPEALDKMFQQFDLLVAARGGEYSPPEGLLDVIAPLALNGELDFVSATEVRTRIASRQPWEHLVPPGTASLIRKCYSSK